METRRFGRSGHMSTVAIFGGAALSQSTQAEADRAMELLLEYGVNHIDIAPSYGHAELRVGPWMPRTRARFFLGCKTMERSRQGAWDEMQRSLENLQTDSFDLYQFHALTEMGDLDQITAPGGALEAVIEAKERGLTRYIGITGHGHKSPAIFLEALRRIDLDSVLFPVDFVDFARPDYRADALALLAECRSKDVGVMAIKAIAKRPWGEADHSYNTWYRPFNDMERIQNAVNFTLSQDVTGICTAGDTNLLPMVLEACENFQPMSASELEAALTSAEQYETIF